MNILWSGGGSQKGKVRKKIGWGEGNIFNLNNIQPEKQFKVCNICIFEEILILLTKKSALKMLKNHTIPKV